ncbi:hypothetical protein ACFL6F_01195 [Planctomycetota bacterium]
MKTICCIVIFYSMIVFGVSPELYAMPVSSAQNQTSSEKMQTRDIAAKLSRQNINVDPDEVFRIMGAQEVSKYSSPGVVLYGGGYYGSPSTGGTSSFFSNVESFLIELVEFFLFLALLSYVVGYEEWLPWEDPEE